MATLAATTTETTTPRSELALSLAGDRALPRLYQQVVVSGIGTVFYTPGGAGGWALDLLLRVYWVYVRRLSTARAARTRAVLARAPRVAQA